MHQKVLILRGIVEVTRAEAKRLTHIHLEILMRGNVGVNIITIITITGISLMRYENEISKFLYILE